MTNRLSLNLSFDNQECNSEISVIIFKLLSFDKSVCMNFLAMNVKEVRRNNLRNLIDAYLSNKTYELQEDFALAVGIDKSYLSQMLMEPEQKGARGVSEAKARQIEEKLSLETGYLDRFEPDSPFGSSEIELGILRPKDKGLENSNYVIVPVFDIKAACGSGYTNQNELIKGGLVFKESFLRRVGISAKLGDSGIITGDGESMSPTLNHDDSVLVDLKVKSLDDVISGKVYAFVANKELRIKRLFKNVNGSLRISSDNNDKTTYPDEIIDVNDLHVIQICGRIKWRGGEL